MTLLDLFSRPSPLQLRHGLSIMLPVPLQRGQVWATLKNLVIGQSGLGHCRCYRLFCAHLLLFRCHYKIHRSPVC